jgi:magnesium chelatase family protein
MGTVSKVFSVAPVGFDGHIVEVESDISRGLPGLQIVGLGNKAIDEARERVKSAITNSLLEYPAKRVTINLAPAELPKDGTHYDLPIALAILAASGQIQQYELSHGVFAGELALDGSVRPISGAITVAETARQHGFTTVYLPTANVPQAALVEGVTLIG